MVAKRHKITNAPLFKKHWDKNFFFLCPFAVYYLRYAVMSFFTISRISLAEGKTAGQKYIVKSP